MKEVRTEPKARGFRCKCDDNAGQKGWCDGPWLECGDRASVWAGAGLHVRLSPGAVLTKYQLDG